MRLAGAAVIDQAQALALGILEVERQAPVALGDLAVRHAVLGEALAPPVERLPPRRRAAPCATIECVPRRSRATGQSKKVMSVPGLASAVGVEQVVGADVVLVHRLLDQAHAERAS